MSRFTPAGSGRDAVTVTVHDGRSSRDEARADLHPREEAVLVRFVAATPFRVGDFLTLPDGSQWPVTAVRDKMSLSGDWAQVVTIGDVVDRG